MKIWFVGLVITAAGCASLAFSQADAGAPKAAPKSAKNSRKSGAASSATRNSAAKSGKSAKRPAGPRAQLAPTPDRYRDIQQALVDKGYLKSAPTGVWDNESADALRQFQADKNLPVTGKINAQSLIGLGLGPKTTTAPPEQPAPDAGQPSAPAASGPAAIPQLGNPQN
jgi:hypothetical protein